MPGLKPTMRRNGCKMVTIRVEAHLSFTEMVNVLCAAYVDPQEIKNRKQLVDAVKYQIAECGYLDAWTWEEHTEAEDVKEKRAAMEALVARYFPDF